VAYRMDPVGLRVTMEHYLPGEGDRLSALCRKHADRLNMPRDWVIDDRRTNNPTLFKVQQPTPTRSEESARSRRKARPFPKPESFDTLSLVRPVVEPAAEPTAEPIVHDVPAEPVVEHVARESPEIEDVVAESVVAESASAEQASESTETLEPTQAMPWRPRFDQDDDLDGVLKPKGRLLSRAFGSDETQFMQRPKQSKDLDREPFDEHEIP